MAGNRKKSEQPKIGLAELIMEPTAEDEEQNVDLEFVERQGLPKSKFPELQSRIDDHMAELNHTQDQVNGLNAARDRQRNSYFRWLFSNAKRAITPQQYKETLDSIITAKISIMKAINADSRKAVRYTNDEAKHLRTYGDYILEEFKTAKRGFLTAYSRYAHLQQAATQLNDEMRTLPCETDEAIEKKKTLDDTVRELGRTRNRMYIYAERGCFMINERETTFNREQALRDVMYEMQKMGESTAMFLQSIEQSYSTTAVLQMAYKTAEALRASFTAESDIAGANGLIATASIKRFASYALPTDHTPQEEQLRNSQDQRIALANEGKQDAIELFLERLSKPIGSITAIPGPAKEYNNASARQTKTDAGNSHQPNGYRTQTELLETLQ